MANDIPNMKLLRHLQERSEVNRVSGCWVWTLSANSAAYANVVRFAAHFEAGDGANYNAHRLAWSALHGPIPENFEVDHLCKRKTCVNPYHLQAVPASVNRARNRIAGQHELSAWWFPSPEFEAPPVSDTGCLPGGTK